MQDINYRYDADINSLFGKSNEFHMEDMRAIYLSKKTNTSVLQTTLDTTMIDGEMVTKGLYERGYGHFKENANIPQMIESDTIPTLRSALKSKFPEMPLEVYFSSHLLQSEALPEDSNESITTLDCTEDSTLSESPFGPWLFTCQSTLQNSTNDVIGTLLIDGIWRGPNDWEVNKVQANILIPGVTETTKPKTLPKLDKQSDIGIIEKNFLQQGLETIATGILPLLASLTFLAAVIFLSMGTAWLIAGLVLSSIAIVNALYQMNEYRKCLDSLQATLFAEQAVLTLEETDSADASFCSETFKSGLEGLDHSFGAPT